MSKLFLKFFAAHQEIPGIWKFKSKIEEHWDSNVGLDMDSI